METLGIGPPNPKSWTLKVLRAESIGLRVGDFCSSRLRGGSGFGTLASLGFEVTREQKHKHFCFMMGSFKEPVRKQAFKPGTPEPKHGGFPGEHLKN